MESYTQAIKELFHQVGNYIEINIDLLKFKAIDKVSRIIAALGSLFITMLIFFVVFFILSIGAAFWVGELLGKIYYGFFVVGGVYAVFGLVFYMLRRKIFKIPLSNKIIKKLFD